MASASTSVYKIRTDGKSTGPKGRYLFWYRDKSGASKVESCDSLQGALDTAWRKEHDQDCTPHAIEGPDGAVPETDMQGWLDARSREAAAERRRWHEERQGQPIYYVQIRSLDGVEATYTIEDDEQQAVRIARELKLPGRVKVYSVIESDASDPGHGEDEQVILDWND
ncbi:hypothetical protein [Nocardia terpenica]|uniref:Uncharacterized protein n=1 Tax=Nocardia terpenica TaxID=455432 RepID=A0A6G9YY45_9NOCA|nr:hypothetical protein [Nocardia terpenica]QIS18031.1 hypothetical protein F6W96_06685 [Nocardia terpenica]